MAKGNIDIVVRRLEQRDLTEADRILRLAFGTFIGLPDPTTFLGETTFERDGLSIRLPRLLLRFVKKSQDQTLRRTGAAWDSSDH